MLCLPWRTMGRVAEGTRIPWGFATQMNDAIRSYTFSLVRLPPFFLTHSSTACPPSSFPGSIPFLLVPCCHGHPNHCQSAGMSLTEMTPRHLGMYGGVQVVRIHEWTPGCWHSLSRVEDQGILKHLMSGEPATCALPTALSCWQAAKSLGPAKGSHAIPRLFINSPLFTSTRWPPSSFWILWN